ncbi:MAG: hypothetical protein F6J98_03770 [Moorea sp. SIO4G2]|uniref:hypothetical protein n=1 Tax=unclassified Moorena TaxID=2683338 RepID=UPI0013FB995E|nr:MULTISPECIES: hypothetical protein [unclassified Moorena]NEO15595.1 hypothetical protein [Moorena sp. SIO3E8]NEO59569.1 hypothetical protein [Moorena sp. SIO4G2]NEQ01009.1 hypothetical protein [Moorena sp. SIO3F7]
MRECANARMRESGIGNRESGIGSGETRDGEQSLDRRSRGARSPSSKAHALGIGKDSRD